MQSIDYIENINDLYRLIKKYSEDYSSNKPLKRIFSLIEKEKTEGTITVIITEEYIDKEWQAEYEKKYKNIFNLQNKEIWEVATKIDFFNGEIKDIPELATYDKKKYLGYLVLRPIPTKKVCEAMIKTPEERNSKSYFITCKSSFSSNIDQHKFNIVATPFIQKDGLTGVCAHACLKMAFDYLIQKFPTSKDIKRKSLTFPEIDDIAKKVVADAYVNTFTVSGLGISHIHKIFEELKCNSLIYNFTEKERDSYDPNELIYWYIESGFPVIVGFQTEEVRHAVVVIGHTFNPNAWWPEAKQDYYRQLLPNRPRCLKSHTWTNFIIQDDNFGPYLTVPTEFPPVLSIAIPIPEEIQIHILPEEAEKIAYSRIESDLYSNITEIKNFKEEVIQWKDETVQWIELFWKHFGEGKLVLRTLLIESKKFKEYFEDANIILKNGFQETNNNEDNISPVINNIYINKLSFPERIWVTELSIPELFSHNRMILGEIIIDPTWLINIFGYEKAILSIHLPGIIGWYDSIANQRFWEIVPDDSPYKHTVHS